MKIFIAFFVSLFGLPSIVAQESINSPTSKKTFVIRKKNDTLSIITNEKIFENDSSFYFSEEINRTTQNEKPFAFSPHAAKTPTLASGEFGLLNILAFNEDMDLKNCNFVAFQYSVNSKGKPVKIKVLKTNDSRLQYLVLRKLENSKWNPAVNLTGEFFEFRLFPQIVIVNERLYEEDYFNDF
jgi:hypothetical protein